MFNNASTPKGTVGALQSAMTRTASSSKLLKERFELPHEALARASENGSLEAESGNVWRQEHENDIAQVVLVHDPGLHVYMGTLHPSGSLYETSVDLERAKAEHANFIRTMQTYNCEVHTVRGLLALKCATNVRERLALEDLAFKSLEYKYDTSLAGEEVVLEPHDEFLLSDDYKRQCIAAMDTEQLVEIVMTRPTITLVKSDRDTPMTATSFAFNPLCNLTFTRDQQITTARGIVLGRMCSRQRWMETEVMKFCFNKLHLPIVGEIVAPGTLEGGDFYPAGDICYIGVGLRTNYDACRQMMKNDWWGTRRVAIVKDLFERSQDRMHLDCMFNIAGDDVTVMLDECMGPTAPTRRLVDEWVRGEDGAYVLARHDVEFAAFIREEGYHIIPISGQHQLEYGCNFVNLGHGNLITVHKETARQIARDPRFKGNVELIEYRSITSMYGSVHCSSQVIKRVPRTASKAADPAARRTASLHANMAAVEACMNGAGAAAEAAANIPGGSGRGMARWEVERARVEGIIAPPRVSSTRGRGAGGGLAQSSSAAIMCAPTSFYAPKSEELKSYNDLRAADAPNARPLSTREVQSRCLREFSGLLAALTERAGMDVHVFHREAYENVANSIFVNNILSTHQRGEAGDAGGQTVVIYPMAGEDRRCEMKEDIRERLRARYRRVVDLSGEAAEGRFLEGTGSLVLDRPSRTAYAAISKRTHPEAAARWARETGYSLVTFTADRGVLHTNMLLMVGSTYALLCAEAIPDAAEAEAVAASLRAAGLDVLPIPRPQMAAFVANSAEVCGRDGEPLLVMSSRAHAALLPAQREALLSKHVKGILHADLETIETVGGGSVRSVLAPLF